MTANAGLMTPMIGLDDGARTRLLTPPHPRRYGRMRLATYGTGDLTRINEQQRAAGELRGEGTLLESRLVATGHYALFNLARATLRPFALRIFVDFNAIGGNIEYFDISYFEWTQLTLKHYEESDAYRHFTSVVWHRTNDGYARTREEELTDQVRALTPPRTATALRQLSAPPRACPKKPS